MFYVIQTAGAGIVHEMPLEKAKFLFDLLELPFEDRFHRDDLLYIR